MAFSKEETLEIKTEREAYKSTLGMVLSTEGLASMLEILDETRSTSRTLTRIQGCLDAGALNKLNKENEKLLSAVGPISP